MSEAETLAGLLARVRACRLCEADLPLGPRPVLRVSATARVMIVGQAPGTKVHESGIPWNDASGERLRDWPSLRSMAGKKIIFLFLPYGRQLRKLVISFRPTAWLFSGWNWIPARLSRPTAAVVWPP